MSRGLLIAGGILGGGALLAVALRERESVMATAEAAPRILYETLRPVYTAIDESAKQVARRIAAVGIGQDVLDNFRKYNIAALLEQYRGDIPWPLAAATVELESGGDPYIYNYYVGKDKHVGHWVPGTPLPTNSWANGLFQILKKYARPATTKGYDIDFADIFDPEKNARAGLKNLQIHWKRAKQAPSDPLRWALFYVGQNRGGGNAEKPGLLQALAHVAAGQLPAIIAAAGIPAAVGGVAARVAARVPLWATVESQLKAGA